MTKPIRTKPHKYDPSKTPKPDETLLALIGRFFVKHDLKSGYKALKREVQRKKLADGLLLTKFEKGLDSELTLNKLLEAWRAPNGEDSSSASESGGSTSDESSTSIDGESDESVSDGDRPVLQKTKKTTTTQSPSDDSLSSSEDEGEEVDQKLNRPRSQSSKSSSASSSSDSDADDEDEKPAKTSSQTPSKLQNKGAASELGTALTTKTSLKRKASPAPSSSSSSGSESDTSDEEPPLKKTKTDEVITTKINNHPRPTKTTGPHESSSSSSESSSDDDPSDAVPGQRPAPENGSSVTSASSTTVMGDQPTIGEKTVNAMAAKKKPHVGARPTPLAELSRQATADSHISNAYRSYEYADRAYQDLSITRGKGFTKEKNKKKRGSYRGGAIDIMGGKGFKFDD